MRSDETVKRLRVLVREKQDAVRALRKIAAREENHVHMLKTWSKSSVENISEIEKLLRRRKKTAAAGKNDSKKTSARTYRNLINLLCLLIYMTMNKFTSMDEYVCI